MNTTILTVKSCKPTYQIKKQLLKQVFKFSLNQLQELLDDYSHTGNEHYWREAKKQREICDKLYLLTL
jgi:hypothetical protein